MRHVPLPAAASIALALAILCFGSASVSQAAPRWKRVMIVILENTNYADALAQPFLGRLAKNGAHLARFYAETHPSQPNYIALTAATFSGVTSNGAVTLPWRHVGDLLEEKGKSWKVYAEGYPGNCFLGAKRGDYVRKHVPFLSFQNVQANPRRCANVVDASVLKRDIAAGNLPDYSLYIPDQKNDGHDTGIEFADRWLGRTFAPLLEERAFMAGMLLAVTFDEASNDQPDNHIYTAFAGEGIKPGSLSMRRYDHYSLLRTIEDAFGLGSLGKNDASAAPITDVWNQQGSSPSGAAGAAQPRTSAESPK